AQLGKAERAHAISHSLLYALGILASFWALAGALIALRAGGQALGWGFQLQSPLFIAGLSFLLVALALNLFGVFEIGGTWTGAGQNLASREGASGAFFSGVLATLVATPCTAPFMGSAMGYALAQPPLASLAVFSFLGLGLALPYVVFSTMPQLTNRLPRPGHWMITFRQFMAFPLLITAWWLLSVLALQSSPLVVFHLLLCLILFAFGAWLWGLEGNRLTRKVPAALIAAGALFWAFIDIQHAPPPNAAVSEHEGWTPYSEAALQAARETGDPVFVDFTAAWCITCQVNKRVALDVASVREKFAQKKVHLFVADWTNQDEAIARKLESFGRNGVPLYVLYPPGKTSEPRILPQLLTPDIVSSALDALGN
ncbi:thioredoxin family protein, partial [bacterium]|nr:thioredoxin family protein [bacterium]